MSITVTTTTRSLHSVQHISKQHKRARAAFKRAFGSLAHKKRQLVTDMKRATGEHNRS